jgi:hypothetical protein
VICGEFAFPYEIGGVPTFGRRNQLHQSRFSLNYKQNTTNVLTTLIIPISAYHCMELRIVVTI